MTPRLQQPLPAPPPSKTSKSPTVWDKEHISETLARISQGFLSNPNSFGEGLGAAMGGLADRQGQLRKDQLKSTSYGGPDGQFEIETDANGNRTIREVPEFAAAVQAKRDAAKAPGAKDAIDFRSRAVHAINQLPPEQRQAAFEDLRRNPAAYGISADGLPDQWSDQYGTVAGGMGQNVNQALGLDLRERALQHRQVTDDRRLDQGDTRIGISQAKEARAATKSSLPKAPPSRKGYTVVQTPAQREALPRGSKYMAPDGSMRIKN